MKRPTRDLWLLTAGCAGAGLVIGAACAAVGGTSLASFLAPLAIAPAFVPRLGRARPIVVGVAGALLFSLGVAITWGFIAPSADDSGWPATLRWLADAWSVLFGWSALLLAGGAAMRPGALAARRSTGTARTAIVTIAAWLWLGFPIWLGPTMGTRGWDAPTWLTAIHPLFAMNHAVIELGIWTQQPVAYQLTPFGQDVSYALPRSLWPFLVTHLLLAFATLAFASACRRLRAAPSRSESAEARPGRLV